MKRWEQKRIFKQIIRTTHTKDLKPRMESVIEKLTQDDEQNWREGRKPTVVTP